jgi:threonyl-tRNA synthetase
MIDITLPDGSVKKVEAGTTALDIAMGISEGLARNVLAAEVAGEVIDSQRPITESSTLKLLTWRDQEGKNTMWHSSAHLLAEALETMFDGIKFWVGPPVEFGFYYDVDFGEHTFTDGHIPAVEKKMLELAKEKTNLFAEN